MRFLPLLLTLAGCGPDCVLGGTWQGVVIDGPWTSERLFLHFDPGAMYSLEVGTATFMGTWTVADNTLSVTDDGCTDQNAVGNYRLQWNGCSEVQLAIVNDACDSRGVALNAILLDMPY
jgi:hypothetical protein